LYFITFKDVFYKRSTKDYIGKEKFPQFEYYLAKMLRGVWSLIQQESNTKNRTFIISYFF